MIGNDLATYYYIVIVGAVCIIAAIIGSVLAIREANEARKHQDPQEDKKE